MNGNTCLDGHRQISKTGQIMKSAREKKKWLRKGRDSWRVEGWHCLSSCDQGDLWERPFKQRPKGSEGANMGDSQRSSIPGDSSCKSPEAEAQLVFSRKIWGRRRCEAVWAKENRGERGQRGCTGLDYYGPCGHWKGSVLYSKWDGNYWQQNNDTL